VAEELFDLTEARRLIKEGARTFFARMREKFPNEVFYVYVLYTTDDDARLASLVANSEQGHEETVAKYRANESMMKSYAERGFEFNPASYRWSFAEWSYIGGAAEMEPFYALIDAVETDDEDEDPTEPPGPETDVDLRAQAYAAMVLGFRDLDAEGFFGVGPEREKVTIFCSMVDSEETVWLEAESAKFLNPPQVYDRFFAEWLPVMTTPEELAKTRAQPSSVHRAFTAVLARHS
jgi:hypothetical protein